MQVKLQPDTHAADRPEGVAGRSGAVDESVFVYLKNQRLLVGRPMDVV